MLWGWSWELISPDCPQEGLGHPPRETFLMLHPTFLCLLWHHLQESWPCEGFWFGQNMCWEQEVVSQLRSNTGWHLPGLLHLLLLRCWGLAPFVSFLTMPIHLSSPVLPQTEVRIIWQQNMEKYPYPLLCTLCCALQEDRKRCQFFLPDTGVVSFASDFRLASYHQSFILPLYVC